MKVNNLSLKQKHNLSYNYNVFFRNWDFNYSFMYFATYYRRIVIGKIPTSQLVNRDINIIFASRTRHDTCSLESFCHILEQKLI